MMLSIESRRHVAISLLQITHYHRLSGYECPTLRGTFIRFRDNFADDISVPSETSHDQKVILCRPVAAHLAMPNAQGVGAYPCGLIQDFCQISLLEGKGSKCREGCLLPKEAVNVSGH